MNIARGILIWFVIVAGLTIGAPAQNAPVITVQPVDRTVVAGAKTSFSVAVFGTGPFTYQWQFNGTNLPGVITTVAGGGPGGDGGPATNASLSSPVGVTVDYSGNLFIADTSDNLIRKVDLNGIITTVAGGGSDDDGASATNASLNSPNAVVLDATGNLFIADFGDRRVRKVGTDGIISTVAGNGLYDYSGDGGQATNAALSGPTGLVVDGSGNLFIADYYINRIRRVGVDGIITTVAGNGVYGFSGDGGPGTNAMLAGPTDVAEDGLGNLFIADYYNNRVRELEITGHIRTFAGDGTPYYSGDGGAATNAGFMAPNGLATDIYGNVFISDAEDNRIRKVGPDGIISTVAGNGTNGFSGDGGDATSAELSYAAGLKVDDAGNLLIADAGNSRIRKVIFQGPTLPLTNVSAQNAGSYEVVITSPTGSVTSSVVTLTVLFPVTIARQPVGQAVVAGNAVTFSVGATGTLPLGYQWYFGGAALAGQTNDSVELAGAGLGNAGNYTVTVSNVCGVVTSSVAVLEVGFSPIITASPGNQTVLAGGQATLAVAVTGTGPFTYQWQLNGANLPNYMVTVAGESAFGFSGDGGAAADANLYFPESVATDGAGNVYVADTYNDRIRKIDTKGIITTVAGNGFGTPDGGAFSGDDGPATNASLYFPTSVAVDGFGNLYLADEENSRVRKVGIDGIITTVAGGGNSFPGIGGAATNATLSGPTSVAVDGMGNLFILDDNTVRKVGTDGILTAVAGNGRFGFSGDGGPATNASFGYFISVVASDASGNLFVADSDNYRIRKVGTNGIITTVAGNGIYGFTGDGGPATNASFQEPYSITVDGQGNLFVGDVSGNRIRKIETNGIITTVAGNGTEGYFGDGGEATNAWLNSPSGLAVDRAGNLIIADTRSSRVREVETNGIITTLAGRGGFGYAGDGGPATRATLNYPSGGSVDSLGNLFIADQSNGRIRRVGTNGIITTVAGNGIEAFSGDGGPAIDASLYYPANAVADGFGNLLIADYNNDRIRKMGSDGVITTVAGGFYGYYGDGNQATNAGLLWPCDGRLDGAGNLLIADAGDNVIRKVAANGIITTVAGNGTGSPFEGAFSGDGGLATNACLNNPSGVAVDAFGNLFIADSSNNRVRRVGTDGIISTVAGIDTNDFSGDGGLATRAALNGPVGIAVDGLGNLFIADYYNGRVRKVDGSGIITTVAGDGLGNYSGDDGIATNLSLFSPRNVWLDNAGDVFIAEFGASRIRKIVAQGPTLTLANLGAANAGNYELVVTSPYGSVTSSVVVLTVTLPALRAAIGGGKDFRLELSGFAGQAYVLQATTSLTPPINWLPVFTNAADSNGNWSFTNSALSANPALFYRVTVP